MNTELKKHFDIKTEMLGPEPNCVKRLTIINRVVAREESGVTWEPDPRHAEIIIDQLGPTGAKLLKLPEVKDPSRRDKLTDQDMEAEVAAVYAKLMSRDHNPAGRADGDTVNHIDVEAGASSRDEILKSDG